MELSLLMKLRIAFSAGAGILLIGILSWPMAQQAEPFEAVSLFESELGPAQTCVLFAAAFVSGLLGFFLSWPYAREIGILAVPAGLSVWAVKSGGIGSLVQTNPTLSQREMLFSAFKWEGVFWLAMVAAGFAGVLTAQAMVSRLKTGRFYEKKSLKQALDATGLLAIAASVVIAYICVKVLVQDIRLFDNKLGSVVAQPAVGQIAFGVIVSFAAAGFAVKKFLGASYIWPTIATAIVTIAAISIYAKQDIFAYMVENHPANFLPNSILAVLPIQMVAFGTLGSITGYWLAVRYDYWRKHEIS